MSHERGSAGSGGRGWADSSVVRSVLAVLLFGLPMVLVMSGRTLLAPNATDHQRVAAERQLDTAISAIEADSDPIAFYTRYLRCLERRANAAPNYLAFWRNFREVLGRRFGEQVRVVVLDGTGSPVAGLVDRPVSRQLAQKFFGGYRDFLEQRRPLSTLLQSFMRAFLGSHVNTERANHSELFVYSLFPIDEYVYFSRPTDKGMFFVFLTPKNPLLQEALIDQLHLFSRNVRDDVRVTLVKRGASARAVTAALGLPPEVANVWWQALHGAPGSSVWLGDTLVMRRALSPSYWLVGSRKMRRLEHLTDDGELDGVGRVCIAVVLFVLLAGLVARRGRRVSVRARLLLGFVYVAGVPLLVLAVSAQQFLGERARVLERAAHDRAERAILRFDAGFASFWTGIAQRVSRHMVSGDQPLSDGFADFVRRFAAVQADYGFQYCRIIDLYGDTVFSFETPEFPVVTDDHFRMPLRYVRAVLALANRGAFATAGADPGRRIVQVDSLLQATKMQIDIESSLQSRVGRHWYHLAQLPLGNAANRLTHVGLLAWSHDHLMRQYVQHGLATFTRDLRPGDAILWDLDNADVFFPAGSRFRRTLHPLLARVVSSRHSFRDVACLGDEAYLLTGLRVTKLDRCAMIVLTPRRAIQAQLTQIRAAFTVGAVAIVGICLLIGTFLSRLFLVPLAQLEAGVQSLARRDFSAPIPVDSANELGLLAASFNEALADLRDLEVARTTQECLFPQTPLRVGGWQVYGSCIAAAQVGGDFFDYAALDDRRVMLAIGDVSGHGVGAALVVAKAKAIISHPATRGDPRATLTALNTVLLAVLRRRKMMSCLFAVLDVEEDTLVLANAGHMYPVQVGHGRAAFMTAVGLPLGSVRNWRPALRGPDRLSDEVVVFFTDGLVEAQCRRDGAPIGYDRLLQALPGLLGPTAVATESAIRAWHRDLAGADLPADDISLLVAQRVAAEVNP